MHCRCDRCRLRKIMAPPSSSPFGVLFLLQSLNVVSFDRTWPAILLVVGVVKLLQSNASSAGHVGALPVAVDCGRATSTGSAAVQSRARCFFREVRNV